MTVITPPALTLTILDAGLQAGQRFELADLVSAHVLQHLSLPTACELVFHRNPGASESVGQLPVGTKVRITVEDQEASLFSGQVTAHTYRYLPDGTREWRVRCYDLLHALRKRHSVRTHVQLRPSELAAELVGDLGIQVEAQEDGPVHELILQHSQNDFELLQYVLSTHGLFFTLQDNALRIVSLAGTQDRARLALGDTLLEASVEINSDRATRTVTSQGWDPLWVEMFESVLIQARSGRRVRAEAAPSSVHGDGQVWFVDADAADAPHLEAMTQAILDERYAREIIVRGIARGDTSLRPGTSVAISGIDDEVAGDHVLTAVSHTFNHEHGYLSEIDTTPPRIPGAPHSVNALIGVVTQVDDPQGFGRVRVSYPSLNDTESGWMQVLSPAAGANKGLVALPDTGDNVLVLCLHRDPSRGIVLGGIFGPLAPYDPGVEGGTVQRYSFRTPAGHRIQFDDAGQSVRIEDSQGSYVEMEPNRMRLHAETDLDIEAPGRAVVIKGQSIDFRRA